MLVRPPYQNDSRALAPESAGSRGGTTSPKAAIVVACRDTAARDVLTEELGKRYGGDYAIVVCRQPGELESRIRELLVADTPVALVIGGIGAQDPDGIEVLAAIRAIDPTASRVAAVRWGEFEAARPLFDAVTGESSTVPGSARRRRCAGGTCSSAAAVTPPGRPRCTWPGGLIT
jgi:hypothetical protein